LEEFDEKDFLTESDHSLKHWQAFSDISR